MAIIVDIKPPLHDTPEPTAIDPDVAPPEYEEESPTSLHQPPAKYTARLEDLPWWKRWLRSPIAISLVFLGCAVIATGVGLAVHFTTMNKTDKDDVQQYPAPGGGGSGYPNVWGGDDAGGPWVNTSKTYQLQLTTNRLEFLSGQSFVDGSTSVQLAPDSQSYIGVSISMRWKQKLVSDGPTVVVGQNNSMSIACNYTSSANVTSYPFITANITLTIPPHFKNADLNMASGAQLPHCWGITMANLTAGDVAFRNVKLEALSGNINVQSITSTTLNATTQYGNILGEADVKGAFHIEAVNGNTFFSNVHDPDHPVTMNHTETATTAVPSEPATQ